ncbi:hypothetical protein [Sutterella sp.]|uniref:hypothetical protein n=1 Tax=Sutterella sp. TaxID=1981025 RepID=UPI0026DFB67E|nr:hypothetical protein [Sutterella sp.]MDO5532590.1 hypothetical protein [Sutterella sp.]
MTDMTTVTLRGLAADGLRILSTYSVSKAGKAMLFPRDADAKLYADGRWRVISGAATPSGDYVLEGEALEQVLDLMRIYRRHYFAMYSEAVSERRKTVPANLAHWLFVSAEIERQMNRREAP